MGQKDRNGQEEPKRAKNQNARLSRWKICEVLQAAGADVQDLGGVIQQSSISVGGLGGTRGAVSAFPGTSTNDSAGVKCLAAWNNDWTTHATEEPGSRVEAIWGETAKAFEERSTRPSGSESGEFGRSGWIFHGGGSLIVDDSAIGHLTWTLIAAGEVMEKTLWCHHFTMRTLPTTCALQRRCLVRCVKCLLQQAESRSPVKIMLGSWLPD